MKSSARPIIAILLIVGAAIAFWTLALSPKRDEATKLDAQIETLDASVTSARSELAQATAARHTFPTAYHQLVELGQAVPSTAILASPDSTRSSTVPMNLAMPKKLPLKVSE